MGAQTKLIVSILIQETLGHRQATNKTLNTEAHKFKTNKANTIIYIWHAHGEGVIRCRAMLGDAVPQ